jgi:tetratricopeptide (TPR) repeat protein
MTTAKTPERLRALLRDLLNKEKSMSELLGLRKEDAPRFIALAARFLEQKDADAAQAAAEAAVACDGDSADAIFALGVTLAHNKEFTRAAACFEKVAAARPNDVAVWTNLGECHLSGMRYAAAADAFRRAMELDPNSEHPSGRRARAIVARTLIKLQKEAK